MIYLDSGADRVEQYSAFEIIMGGVFHRLYGSTTESLNKQSYWNMIQRLKSLARETNTANDFNLAAWYWRE